MLKRSTGEHTHTYTQNKIHTVVAKEVGGLDLLLNVESYRKEKGH